MAGGTGEASVRAFVDIVGVAVSATVAIVTAAADTTIVTSGAVVAVLGFAGLLVREVVKQHRTLWEMIEAARDGEHYARWEVERLRFAYGDRAVDPGPYIPRRAPQGAAK